LSESRDAFDILGLGRRDERRRQRVPVAGLVAAGLALGGFGVGPAAAEGGKYDLARAAHPDLFKAYYDEGVLEYCGLVTRESMGGFYLRRDDLLTARPLSDDEYRNVRIAAGIAVDLEYEDRGLSGQRNWCTTEGIEAYNRFVLRYRLEPGTLPNPQ
jgi:hypothetical protein